MLKFDKDITSGEKKQHDASALIYDLSHHVIRWLAYFSNGGASVLVSHSGLMSSHRVFWLDLIRQHPVTSGTSRDNVVFWIILVYPELKEIQLDTCDIFSTEW